MSHTEVLLKELEDHGVDIAKLAKNPATDPAGVFNGLQISDDDALDTNAFNQAVSEAIDPPVTTTKDFALPLIPTRKASPEQVAEPAIDSQFANSESPEQSEAAPDPEVEAAVKIHPLDLGLLLEKAAEESPDTQVAVDDVKRLVTFNGVTYLQTSEVPPSSEAKDHFEAQLAAYRVEQKRNSVAGIREELDALKAEVVELSKRIDDHNQRSGHKI